MPASPSFVVIGAGGLGCPALIGLGAAGASRIQVVDHDRVETSNLGRQVLFDVSMVGMPKARAAAIALSRRHPQLQVRPETRRVDPQDAADFVRGLEPASVVLGCTDQPPVKFALNDACIAAGIPLVIGAALRWGGQAMAILPGHTCYRCIYEAPPPDELVPSCERAGVLGAAVGHVGAVMAALAWRLAERTPQTAGRLMTIDAHSAEVRTMAPHPRSSCPACRAISSACEPSSEPIRGQRAT